MNICHINTERNFGGGEQQTYYLIQGLKEKGVKSFLVTQSDSELFQRTKSIISLKNILNLPIIGEFDLKAILKIRNFLKNNKIEILHCHTSHALTIGFFSSFGLNIPIVATRRVNFSIKKNKINFLSKLKYKKFPDKIVAISKIIKENLIKEGVGKEKITVIYSGIDIDRFEKVSYDYLYKELEIPKQAIVILNIASLLPVKGQKILIESFRRVVEKVHKKIYLIIVGEGYLKDELKKIITKLNLEDKVILTGFRKDVGSFLKISDIFVISSLEEGLCSSILDALSLNKIVIASNVGGIPEIIISNKIGILTEPKSEDFSEKILEVINNLEKYKEKYSKGKDYVKEKFSVKNMVEENFKVYQQLIKTK